MLLIYRGENIRKERRQLANEVKLMVYIDVQNRAQASELPPGFFPLLWKEMEKEALRIGELGICEILETQRGFPFALWLNDIRNYGNNWPLVSESKSKDTSDTSPVPGQAWRLGLWDQLCWEYSEALKTHCSGDPGKSSSWKAGKRILQFQECSPLKKISKSAQWLESFCVLTVFQDPGCGRHYKHCPF